MNAWPFRLPWDAINAWSGFYGVDPLWIGALCREESTCRIDATRFEPDYKWLFSVSQFATAEEIRGQKTSWGYMQVMGAVAREYGFKGDFDDLLSNRSIEYGCRHFAFMLKKNHGSYLDAVASYNAGSPRDVAPKDGHVDNYKYVERVQDFRDLLVAASVRFK